jgi:hypothetical protein
VDESHKTTHGLFSSEQAICRLKRLDELDYLAHVVFRIYEERAVPETDPCRFRLEIGISGGVGDGSAGPPVAAAEVLEGKLGLKEVSASARR